MERWSGVGQSLGTFCVEGLAGLWLLFPLTHKRLSGKRARTTRHANILLPTSQNRDVGHPEMVVTLNP